MNAQKNSRIKQANKVFQLSSDMLKKGKVRAAYLKHCESFLPVRDEGQETSMEGSLSFTQTEALKSDELCGVLVFGSARKTGGGYLTGAKAQEEDVSLLGTWGVQAAAVNDFYKNDTVLGPDSVLIAKGYWLFDGRWRPLEKKAVVFAGISAPNLKRKEAKEADKAVLRKHLAARVAGALDGMFENGCACAVLGAIGCGVFEWDPKESAQAVRQGILKHQANHGKNMRIVLAIPDKTFLDVFENEMKGNGDLWKKPRKTFA